MKDEYKHRLYIDRKDNPINIVPYGKPIKWNHEEQMWLYVYDSKKQEQKDNFNFIFNKNKVK